jgi:hypothetical protein
MRHLRIPPTICPECHSVRDGVTDPFGLNSPSAGSIFICITCGGLGQVQKDHSVAAVTPQYLLHLAFDRPESYQKLMHMQETVRQEVATRGKQKRRKVRGKTKRRPT